MVDGNSTMSLGTEMEPEGDMHGGRVTASWRRMRLENMMERWAAEWTLVSVF
jgi:hypothetical protein